MKIIQRLIEINTRIPEDWKDGLIIVIGVCVGLFLIVTVYLGLVAYANWLANLLGIG